ncbi:riboflavin biosynthesis protein RibF [Lactobacillus sp. PV037]|uniref:riboflavin biosynthesis protein RibF n=1 Tax=Lactobacillus sp. PV037 TaxID=2594496 RepID=UPI00223F2BEE|nr:riboflavin biosynthesis protein RibF [Lactobacillus sp. PV037]QNQ83830.1 riboflavin biosynthesis protein RibF [Lactobacillus sp. PV037]
MKVLSLTYPWQEEVTNTGVVLALGFFDGVHLGHQKLIKDAKKISLEKNLPLMVMTFTKHPLETLDTTKKVQYLSTNDEKIKYFEKLGVDYLLFVNFTPKFSKLTPAEFVNKVIWSLKAKVVIAGFDYTYGSNKNIANMENLPRFAKGRFVTKMEPKQNYKDKKISSSRIREAIKNGEMSLAAQLLGHPYEITGEIVHGFRRGHELGFPTANIDISGKKVLPKPGVYATKAKIDGKWYEAMTSVGYNDTFENKNLTIETHLFGFDEEAYGKELTVAWYKFMRDNVKFDGVENLIKQLKSDERNIKQYFKDK